MLTSGHTHFHLNDHFHIPNYVYFNIKILKKIYEISTWLILCIISHPSRKTCTTQLLINLALMYLFSIIQNCVFYQCFSFWTKFPINRQHADTPKANRMKRMTYAQHMKVCIWSYHAWDLYGSLSNVQILKLEKKFDFCTIFHHLNYHGWLLLMDPVLIQHLIIS